MSERFYKPEIDGLRALAIIPVVLYHAWPEWVPGGFLGVDVFFVISGYLITQLILKELDQERFSLGDFWERRARRLLPAALLMGITCWLLGFFLLLPSELVRLSEEIIFQNLFVSNIYFWLNIDYFAPKADLRPLLHTWSLSVEEQFYLFVAPLLSFTWLRWQTSGVRSIVWAVTVGSFISAIALRYIDQDASFFLLPSRAWELGLGAILAVHSPKPSQMFASALATAGLVMLFLAYANAPSGPSPSKAAFLAAFGAAFIIAGTCSSNLVSLALRVRPLVWIGLLSYSLYLWHWPALSFLTILRGELRSSVDTTLALCFAFAAALISYRFIEVPIRRKQLLARRRGLFAGVAVALILTTGAGLITVAADGLEARWSARALELARGESDRYIRLDECTELPPEKFKNKEFCRLGSSRNNHIGRVVVLGDSHAAAMMPLFDDWADANGFLGWQAARPRCKPFASRPAACGLFSRYVIEFMTNTLPTDVIIVARWEQAYGLPWYAADLERGVQDLTNAGARVWLVRQVPNPRVVVPTNLARAHELGWTPVQNRTDKYLATTRMTENVVLAEVTPYATGVLDPMQALCDRSHCAVEIEGKSGYTDDNHLSNAGALALIEILAPITAAISAHR